MGKYYRISGVVKFPEGLAAGESRGANAIEIARISSSDIYCRCLRHGQTR